MSTEQDYDAAAEWAQKDMTLAPGSTTALRGTAAADLGRGLLERATDGGPLSTRQPVQGNVPKVRQVRAPADVGAGLDALARAQNRRVSDVMRDALIDYISTHRAG